MNGAKGSMDVLVQTKTSFQEPNLPRRIQKVSFGLMPSTEIMNTAEFHVFERALYKMPERKPQANGVLDPRLGVSNKRAVCETCGQMLAECTGHFGYIELELPVFHIGYFKNTLQILQCICKGCARVLLNDDERRAFAKRFRNDRMERVRRELLFKKLLDRCKRVKLCPHCGETNGPVKKAPSSLKVIHDVWTKNQEGQAAYFSEELSNAAELNESIRANIKNIMDDLNPLRVQGLFRAIPDEDCEVLDLAGRPEDLLLTHIPVPPVCIRPSVEMDAGAGSNEDDLTVKLMQIVEVNNILRHGLVRGLPMSNIAENWDFLQVQCAVYINSDLPGITSMYQVPGKPTRGFVQRLKGKQGRFRGNLSGKRVDFSGRTVISPNPHLSVEQVGIPRLMAMTLTYPERVTDANINKLRERVKSGSSVHPGANFVAFPNGDKVFLKFGDRKRIANELKVGDIVERHLDDGDIVLFNRQPSLHRMSIMAHRVRVLEGRTLRFNECVCAPYNADFDGDEMNIHVPQTEEARAEARELMGVRKNLATPKSGEILIAATQDFLTTSFLLTSKDVFLTRPQISMIASFFLEYGEGDSTSLSIGKVAKRRTILTLPEPAIRRPLELWTGKQAFSLLLCPDTNNANSLAVTLETREKNYGSGTPGKKREDLHMDLADGYVCFRSSELISGRLGKSTLGGGNKSGLFQVLSSDYGATEAVRVMNRLAKLSARLVGEFGFSIGIDDVTPAPKVEQDKRSAVKEGYAKCEEYIADFKSGRLELSPGCDADTSLENVVTGELNSIRERAAAACMSGLHRHNSPLIMSQCGSKGSPINIAQMVACVGQQSVSGRRAPNGFKGRTLPHFPRDDRTPEGKGFVANSFYSGLTPTEFFFHTMAGREGLVDTAVKTAETGYMSRRLMKALEDLYVHYDGSVRNAARGIVQLQYGEDGMDPVGMEGRKGDPVAFDRLLALARLGWKDPSQTSNAQIEQDAVFDHQKARKSKRARLTPVAQSRSVEEHVLLPEELKTAVNDLLSSTLTVHRVELENNAVLGVKEEDKGKPLAFEAIGKTENGGKLSSSLPRQSPTTYTSTATMCSQRFYDDILAFLLQIANVTAQVREEIGLKLDDRGCNSLERLLRSIGLTRSQLEKFVALCIARHRQKCVDPGATVGAVGAQSIGEPGTQMTLKTFHFAGVASMNVTLGVPRIKEIINAARVIATPLMEVHLEPMSSLSNEKLESELEEETRARLVKGRLERTTLGEVSARIRQEYSGQAAYIRIDLDTAAIDALQLHLTAADVKYKLLESSKLKLKGDRIKLKGTSTLFVYPPGIDDKDFKDDKRKPLASTMSLLLSALPEVVVVGIPTVSRAVLSRAQGNKLVIFVEGTGMVDVMGTLGVDGTKVKNNNVMEVAKTLGIEAARATIIQQIEYTMEQHGMAIDSRHTMLLADCMTNKGEVLGITRFGIAKMKDSVLMLASFEKTTDHLFDAALHGRVDEVSGVSECIIMGIPMPVGTGLFKLLHQSSGLGEGPLTCRSPPVLGND